MLGQEIAQALPELRAQAESLMVGTCDIERQSSAWSEAEQKTVTTWVPVHMDEPCAFVEEQATSRAMLADELATPAGPQVKVRHDLDGIQPDDRVTVAGIGVVWVTHAPIRHNQVQRRLECRWSR